MKYKKLREYLQHRLQNEWESMLDSILEAEFADVQIPDETSAGTTATPTGESKEKLVEKIKEKLQDENISPEGELRLIKLMKMRNNLI